LSLFETGETLFPLATLSFQPIQEQQDVPHAEGVYRHPHQRILLPCAQEPGLPGDGVPEQEVVGEHRPRGVDQEAGREQRHELKEDPPSVRQLHPVGQHHQGLRHRRRDDVGPDRPRPPVHPSQRGPPGPPRGPRRGRPRVDLPADAEGGGQPGHPSEHSQPVHGQPRSKLQAEPCSP